MLRAEHRSRAPTPHRCFVDVEKGHEKGSRSDPENEGKKLAPTVIA